MSDDCIDIERIAEVLELPEDDPRRRHLEECPRCSALLFSYREFVAAGDRPGADPGDAQRRLDRFIESEFERPAPDPSAAGSGPGRPGLLFELLGGLARRPAWVVAALVVVAAAVVWWRPWVEEPPVLRGRPAGAPAAPLELSAPEILEDGSLRLSWALLPAADSYQVRLYDGDLTEIARFDTGALASFEIRRSMLPGGAPRTMLWRVAAFAEGEEIAVSAPSRLEF